MPAMRAMHTRRRATDSEKARARIGYGRYQGNHGSYWYDAPYYSQRTNRRAGARFKRNAATAGGKYFTVDSKGAKLSSSTKPPSSRSKKSKDVNSEFERRYKAIPTISGKKLLDERELGSKQKRCKVKSSSKKTPSKSKSGAKRGRKKSKRKSTKRNRRKKSS